MLTDRQERIKERMYEDDFIGYLEELIAEEKLMDSKAALGIAKKITSEKTLANLTERQIDTLIMYGIDVEENYISSCSVCSEELPWCEMSYGAYIDKCSWCQQRDSKED